MHSALCAIVGRSVPASDIRSVPVEKRFQDTLAVLKYLSHDNPDGKSLQVNFVGSSMGGFVGMQLAAHYPWLLKSLTCAYTSCADELSRRISKLPNALVLFEHVPLMTARLIAKVMQKLIGASCGSKEFNDVKRIVDSVGSEVAKVAHGVTERRYGTKRHLRVTMAMSNVARGHKLIQLTPNIIAEF